MSKINKYTLKITCVRVNIKKHKLQIHRYMLRLNGYIYHGCVYQPRIITCNLYPSWMCISTKNKYM